VTDADDTLRFGDRLLTVTLDRPLPDGRERVAVPPASVARLD
jgi:hypothetical protein